MTDEEHEQLARLRRELADVQMIAAELPKVIEAMTRRLAKLLIISGQRTADYIARASATAEELAAVERGVD